MPEPTVAVIIPTYNRSRYLREAIESVLAQTRPADEIIVVDDGSTDDTPQLCASYSRVRYIRQENQGQAVARNRGMREAKSEYLWFLDDDDMLVETAIESNLAAMTVNGKADLVYARSRRINADGHIMGEDLVNHRMPRNLIFSLSQDNFIRIQTVLARRDAVVKSGGFDKNMVPCEDYELWLRMATLGYRITYNPSIVALYRNHQGSVSRQHERMARAFLEAVNKNIPVDRQYLTANAHYRLGRVLLDEGRNVEAAVGFKQAAKGRPFSIRYRAYGWIASRPSRYSEGYKVLRNIKRSFVNYLVRFGVVERRWGK